MQLPDQQVLLDLLKYEPTTGKLFWKNRPLGYFKTQKQKEAWDAIYAGKEAFNTKTGNGYLQGRLFACVYKTHRIIFKMLHGWEPLQVDHDDGDRSNNRPLNLKASSQELNQKNRKKNSDNTSGITGVSWNSVKRKWRARIGKQLLGYFDDFDEAVLVRVQAENTLNYHPNHGKRV